MSKSKKEWALLIVSALLTATAFFGLGYVIGKQNIKSPIVIENY